MSWEAASKEIQRPAAGLLRTYTFLAAREAVKMPHSYEFTGQFVQLR